MGAIRLLDTGLDDGWGSATVLDGTGRAAASLDGLDDALGGGIIVRDLAEDDVAAVEPAGDDGGDEELGAVAGNCNVSGFVRGDERRRGSSDEQVTYVLGPALAMDRRKGLLWVSLKFSSANFSP